MTIDIIKRLMDCSFQAKKITELTPPLPLKMVPRHNNIIEAIKDIGDKKERVYISDVSRSLGTTAPSITKLINQLEEIGYLIKITNEKDRRYVSIKLTEKGENHYKVYVEEYHKHLCELLEGLNEEDCLTAVNIINQVYDIMKENS